MRMAALDLIDFFQSLGIYLDFYMFFKSRSTILIFKSRNAQLVIEYLDLLSVWFVKKVRKVY